MSEQCINCEALASMYQGQIDELLKKTTWIPVSERLPENGQRVLCWAVDIEEIKTCSTGHFQLWHWDEQAPLYMGRRPITHWMPLPAPPDI